MAVPEENQETLQKRDRALAEFTTVFRAVANLTAAFMQVETQAFDLLET